MSVGVTIVEKGWGREVIWADNIRYAGKLLEFHEGGTMSMHFHAKKHETWYVLSGKFNLRIIHTENATVLNRNIGVGDTWVNEPYLPHQLICLEAGTVLEVSNEDDEHDNYRVFPGDSQK